MSSSTTSDSSPLRLAMLGMIEGNGHPYSWSAIINGYEPEGLARCPYAMIRAYVGRHPPESVGIPGARVTHLWTDNPADAEVVAAVGRIPNIVSRPEDVIGQVDAVIIATDDGNDHVRRVRPFIEAGLPAFIDKPLAINVPDLQQFIDWHRAGAVMLSTSGMRYAPELDFTDEQRATLGDLRWIHSCTIKTWERYGIHALETTHPFLGSGYTSVRAATDAAGDVMFVTHRSGVRVTLASMFDAMGCLGSMHFYGSKSGLPVSLVDTYTTFRRQLAAFIDFLRTGRRPLPFHETVELMAVIIAGMRSRERGGAEVSVESVLSELTGL
ncbi:MAG: Gfo/Idh/MocA family oxidoreductase [Verrucomicrobiaceae bacterium]|nr:Gfo/Idh/MocA family oxidoreductase [Verrucomicrobiaceae bacterium]